MACRKTGQYVLAGMITCCLRKFPHACQEILYFKTSPINNERIFQYVLLDDKLGIQDGGKCRNLEL